MSCNTVIDYLEHAGFGTLRQIKLSVDKDIPVRKVLNYYIKMGRVKLFVTKAHAGFTERSPKYIVRHQYIVRHPRIEAITHYQLVKEINNEKV
jgi:hypothetical protein